MSPGGSDGDGEGDELHEINVTPFIDVMLVLLIVFMVAAPLSTVDVPVTLPGTAPGPRPPAADPLTLTLTRAGGLVLGETPVPAEALGAALDAATGGDRTVRVHLRADHLAEYGAVMTVLTRLRGAGYLQVALVGIEALPPLDPPAAPGGSGTP